MRGLAIARSLVDLIADTIFMESSGTPSSMQSIRWIQCVDTREMKFLERTPRLQFISVMCSQRACWCRESITSMAGSIDRSIKACVRIARMSENVNGIDF